MARKFKISVPTGRQTVLPFTKAEVDNMRIYCKKKRDIETDTRERKLSNPHWSKRFQWDRNYMLIDLGVNTALRIGDLLTLRVSNELKKGYVDIKENKTKRNKPFELNKRIAKELNDYIERNELDDGEYLFQTREGWNLPIARQQAYNIIKQVSKAIGVIRKVGCHSLRKTFGRLYYEQTKDLVGLHQMIHSGKGDPTVTLIYIAVIDSEINANRKKFDI